MPSHPTVLATTAAPASSSGAFYGPTTVPPTTDNPSPIALPRSALSTSAQQAGYQYSNPSNAASSGHSHIASALVHHPAQSFSAASLPRTSSLLPPPHLKTAHSPGDYTPPKFQNPFNALPSASVPADPLNEPDPIPPRTRPSRSSSAGGVPESFRNHNRWSNSSASSQASNPRPSHTRPPSLGRRMSVDAVALQLQSNAAPAIPQTPRKLQKNRPTTPSSGSTRPAAAASRVRQQSPAPVPPLTSLPPIVTLPSLEQEVRGGSPSLAGRAVPLPRPRYFRSPDTDDTEHLWDDNIAEAVAVEVDQTQSPAKRTNGADNSTMPNDRNGDNGQPKGHTRNRSQTAKGSADSSKSKSGKTPSQKAMLSKALQKANTAVKLDNATNVGGAREAYAEACDLLQQVLARTTGDEDRRKLEAIRKTYTTRITELDRLNPAKAIDRPLPKPPQSSEKPTPQPQDESEEESIIAPAKVTRTANDHAEPRTIPSYTNPLSAARAQPTFTPGPPDIPGYGPSSNPTEQYTLQSSFSRGPRRDPSTNGLPLPPPAGQLYMPPPLSPRRPPSPAKQADLESPLDVPLRTDFAVQANRATPDSIKGRGHVRGNSHESISWLDPIDESGGSGASSVHSRSSSMGIRRKHIRAASGDTEAEFDAALDDAIEAAYDDGFEPMDENDMNRYEEDGEAVVAKAMRKVELAKERVRESEREALALASDRERRLREQLEQQEREEQEGFGEPEDFYDGNNSDEEERMLEEMTTGYAIEDFSFGPLKSGKSSIPRASDSSEFTSRTWHSSMASNPPTATTVMSTLSTVSENTVFPGLKKGVSNMMPPPPTHALPQIPQLPRTMPDPRPLLQQSPTKDSVRDRRLSGQNPKELKIETSKVGLNAPTASPTKAAQATTGQAKAGGFIAQQRQALTGGPNRAASSLSRRVPSPAPAASPAEAPPPTPPLPPGALQDLEGRSGSPSVNKPGLRKNFSSSSLKSMKSRNMSVTNLDDASDISPGTPLNPQFGANPRLPAMPSLPTPVATAFKERIAAGGGTGGLYLFDNDFHSPNSPGSPNPVAQDGPAALEPCPNDVLLRPFWLMRCLFQTLANPRGGYISNKLFVPRDVWKVKGVKLKSVEEKIANCDLLTAALLKLAKVDTCDADAVLEEMQALEGILEQVQASLTRKLGNEVGVQGSSAMFKDASTGDLDAASTVPRSGSVSGKPSSFSWRRLRSKNSSAGLSSTYAGMARKESLTDTSKEGLTMASLPMTSHPTSKPTRRDAAGLQFSGPNANYMGALARLFDAAQAIDQIARQVEDPGLRHADKTQVGLELCTRHAAEFFGFYVCRFVLSDLTTLLDKFVKRGSEWVLV